MILLAFAPGFCTVRVIEQLNINMCFIYRVILSTLAKLANYESKTKRVDSNHPDICNFSIFWFVEHQKTTISSKRLTGYWRIFKKSKFCWHMSWCLWSSPDSKLTSVVKVKKSPCIWAWTDKFGDIWYGLSMFRKIAFSPSSHLLQKQKHKWSVGKLINFIHNFVVLNNWF